MSRKLRKPNFSNYELDIPKDKELLTRYAYEWFIQDEVKLYFNLAQDRAKITYEYTKAMIKKTSIVALTGTAVAVTALMVAISCFYRKK